MDDSQTPSSSAFNTYHCLCSNLVLATAHKLETLPRRTEPVKDGALIIPPPTSISPSSDVDADDILSRSISSVLLNVLPDRRPVIVQREDGFERRILLRCGRCKLVLGYGIDAVQESSATYLLPGGLVETGDMVKGSRPEVPAWAEQTG